MPRFSIPSIPCRRARAAWPLLLGALVPAAWAQHTPLAPGVPVRAAHVFHVPGESPTIQAAIRRARQGDVVIVAPGTYVEVLDFLGKAIEVVGTEGPTRTILRPPGTSPVVLFRNGEGPDSRLIGFTVRGGEGDFDGAGGGISCSAFGPVANPYISDCIVEQNFTDQTFSGLGGAGIDGDPLLERCILRRNVTFSPQTGGGLQGAPWMSHCLIEDNTGCYGGGLRLLGGARVLDSILRRNSAGPCGNRDFPLEARGGALEAADDVLVERCLLIDNRVDEGTDPHDPGFCVSLSSAGAAFGQDALLLRCTIAGNRAENCALVGGIAGDPRLVDCILRDNEHAPGEYAGRTRFTYSDVEGGAAGRGSFDGDPRFVNPGAGDLRLRDNSPCIDAGDPAGASDPDGTRGDVGALHHPQGESPLASAWHEGARLQPADTALSRAFGQAVAFSGSTALIGASESAYVFERQGATWTEAARLVPNAPSPDQDFGHAVALDGGVAVVGAPSLAGPAPAAVYVFEGDAGGAFVETARLESALHAFGVAVALDGAFLVVGAPEDFLGMGRALVYHRFARGRWLQVAELASPHLPSFFEPEGDFGAAVALAGGTLVVGEEFAGDQNDLQRPGSAFVYQRAGASPYSWVRVAELGPENPQNYGRFGSSVSVDGERVLVGSNLGVQAYGGGEPGLPWRRHERFGASVPTRVLVAGDRVFLAQPSGVREFHQPGAGAAWNSVTRVTTLSGPIAAAGGTLLVGSPAEDGLVGAVHVFTRGVEIDVLGLDQAADEEEVVIRGRGLDAVTRLLVGGVEQPIVRQSATELAVRAPRRDPGFADLALESPQGVFAMSGAWRAAPTLTAETTGPGGTLDFELVNGTTGAYVLSYGLRLNGAPVPVVDPPTWYGLWLDLAPGLWGRLAVDAFDSSGTSRPSFALPRLPGLAGLTVHFQAFCRRGLFGPGRYSFTNLASVTF